MTSLGPPRQWCPRCKAEHPTETCKTIKLGRDPALLCPACGMITREVRDEVRSPLGDAMSETWTFPAKGDGWIALLALGLGVWLVSHVPLVGLWMAFGFVAAYLFSVIVNSAKGAPTMPAAVDWLGWSDLAAPTVRAFASIAFALWPLWIALYVHERSPSPLTLAFCALAVLFAIAWAPAAMVVAAHQQGCLASFNPIPVVLVIRQIPGDYFRTVGRLLIQSMVASAVTRVADAIAHGVASLGPVGWPVTIAFTAVTLYMPVVMARTLGVLVHQRAMELGVERRPGGPGR